MAETPLNVPPHSLAAPAPESPRRKPIRVTPAKLRAQRANARLSRGPRTPEGRRRSALNRLDTSLAYLLEPGEARELRRIWRDLMAQFFFLKPELWRGDAWLEIRLQWVATAWWLKLALVQNGVQGEKLWDADRNIEQYYLPRFLNQARMGNQKTDYWLRKQFGADGHHGDMPSLRKAIEARLGAFKDAAEALRRQRKRGRVSESGKPSLEGAPMGGKGLSNPN